MKAVRGILIALLVLGGSYLLYDFCWAPVICSHIQRRLRLASLAAVDASSYRAAAMARNNLEAIRGCNQRCTPAPPDIAMITALNQRILGRADDAVATYQNALRYAKRPELYLNLGLALVESNRRQAAIQPLTAAAEFAPYVTSEIQDGELREIVEGAVRDRDQRLRAAGR